MVGFATTRLTFWETWTYPMATPKDLFTCETRLLCRPRCNKSRSAFDLEKACLIFLLAFWNSYPLSITRTEITRLPFTIHQSATGAPSNTSLPMRGRGTPRSIHATDAEEKAGIGDCFLIGSVLQTRLHPSAMFFIQVQKPMSVRWERCFLRLISLKLFYTNNN